jgi:glucose dehydrogenase
LTDAKDSEISWAFRNRNVVLPLVLALCVFGVIGAKAGSQSNAARETGSGNTDWPVYGGSYANTKYSKLAKTNVHNVANLKEVRRFESNQTGGLETTPVIIGKVLYAYTPKQEVIALDAASGKLIWKSDWYGADRIGDDLFANSFIALDLSGKGRMPGFPSLDPPAGSQFKALANYLISGEPDQVASSKASDDGKVHYDSTGYPKFLDLQGYPANTMPWGTLNAINLDTGEYLWKIPFGQYPELVAHGMPNTGSENYGGPAVTAGGVLFIGASVRDKKFRAFDKVTGKLLWETLLPFSGCATPATYEIDGRQYVVIAAGGQRDPSTPAGGGVYAAYALPQ